MKVPRIAVVGSSNTDLVINCPRLPQPGETLLGGDLHRYAGGKGANQAVAAARAGAKVAFIGGHGADDFGRAARAGLRAEGIDVRHFRASEKLPSGVALILLGKKDRQNQIVVADSANAITPADIDRAAPVLKNSSVIVAQLETPIPSVRRAAEIAREAGIPFVLNPAPAFPLPSALYRLVDTLTPNETEAASLTGLTDPEQAALALRKKGCRRVVITLGTRGALLCDEDGFFHVPVPKVKPRDTVGAGDCLNAWLAVGIAESLPIRDALRRAVHAASLKVTRLGAQPGMPPRADVEAFLRRKSR